MPAGIILVIELETIAGAYLCNTVLIVIFEFQLESGRRVREQQIAIAVTRQAKTAGLILDARESRLFGPLYTAARRKLIHPAAYGCDIPSRRRPGNSRSGKLTCAVPPLGIAGVPIGKTPIGAPIVNALAVHKQEIHPRKRPRVTHRKDIETMRSANPEGS